MPGTPRVIEGRREQIIDAAMHVFAKKGFARATNRDVAHEAGITTGLIYYYFESKEALLKAVLEAYSPAQVLTEITPEMSEQPPEVFLPLVIKRVLDIVESEQFVDLIRVMLPEMLHGSDMSPVVVNILERVVGFLSSYLGLQVARGNVGADIDRELVCQVMTGSVMGFVVRRQIMRDPSVLHYTHEEMAQAIVGTILEGIRPR
jgi:AcrR family transcriptional regulator